MRRRRFWSLLLLVALSSGGHVLAQQRPGVGVKHLRQGNEKYARAEYEAAIQEYGRVPREAGEIYAQALYNIGVCDYELWRTDDAVAMYRRAIAAAPGGAYPKALYALGVALEDLGRIADAADAYAQIVNGAGGWATAPAHFRLGLLAARQRDHERAAIQFRKAVESATEKFPASRNNLGVMLARMGRLTEAGCEFELALREAGGTFAEAAQNLAVSRALSPGQEQEPPPQSSEPGAAKFKLVATITTGHVR